MVEFLSGLSGRKETRSHFGRDETRCPAQGGMLFLKQAKKELPGKG